MAAGKMYLAARASRKPRNMRRRKMRLARSLRPKQPQMTVTRTVWTQNWVPATTATTDFWKYLTTNLAQLPDVSQYQNLFEEYRINNLTFVFRPRYDNFAGNDTTDTTLPGVTNQGMTHLHVIVDPKSVITPSGTYTFNTLNTFLEQGKVRSYTGNKPVTIKVKYPCITDDVNGTANTVIRRAKFIRTDQTAIPHRGIHVFAQDVNLTGVFGQSWDIFIKYSITFRGMR